MPQKKKSKVAVIISIGGKPPKNDMKKAKFQMGDPTRPFGKPMQPGDPLIDTKTGKDLDSTHGLLPFDEKEAELEELERYFLGGKEHFGTPSERDYEMEAQRALREDERLRGSRVDQEALRESNPEAFEMDDPRWKKREPAPRGYEYDDDERLRRIIPEKPKDIFRNSNIVRNSVNPMVVAWGLLKALPEQQMFEPAYSKTNLGETRWDGEGFDAGEGQRAMGTVHPAIYGLLQREQDRRDRELMGDDHPPRTGERALPNLNLDTARQANTNRLTASKSPFARPSLESHPDWWEFASSGRQLGEGSDEGSKMTRAPQTYAYEKDHPTNQEVSEFGEDYPEWMQEALKNTTLGRRSARAEEGR